MGRIMPSIAWPSLRILRTVCSQARRCIPGLDAIRKSARASIGGYRVTTAIVDGQLPKDRVLLGLWLHVRQTKTALWSRCHGRLLLDNTVCSSP